MNDFAGFGLVWFGLLSFDLSQRQYRRTREMFGLGAALHEMKSCFSYDFKLYFSANG